MLTAEVVLSDIDLNDTTYLISDVAPDQKLIDSISELGLINPVKLIKKGNGYIVLSGWKRINVANQLGSNSVYAQVYETAEFSTEQICRLIYSDNKERISELEKAELLKIISDYGDIDQNYIVENVLPFFGLNPTLNNLKKQLSVASIEPELKKGCNEGKLSFEQLHMLSEIDEPELREAIYKHLLKVYKFNNNETRDLIKDLETVIRRRKLSVDELAGQIISKNNGKTDRNTIRKTIKELCYPKLVKTEQKYNELVKKLKLGKTSRLVNHPYFESNEIELRIKIKEKNDLIEEIEKLRISVNDGRIEELLNLIKEGF